MTADAMAVAATSSTTLRRAVLPRAGWLTDAVLVVAGVALIALSAQVAIPLPVSPVPVTGQTFAVLLVGTAYGLARGALTMALYLAAGFAGAPVFAQQHGGLDVLGSPTAGYLFGMLVATGLAGALAERGWDRRVPTTVASMALGNLVIYAFGVPGLMLALGVDFGRALALGVVPFLAGDALKIALAAGLLPATWRLLR
nr:biotin transporter BioY [Carbonactinospora thermoautotrophica]